MTKEKKIKRGFNWNKYGDAVGMAILILLISLAIAAGWGTMANLPATWNVAARIIIGIVAGAVALFLESLITFLILIVTDKDYDNPSPFPHDLRTGP